VIEAATQEFQITGSWTEPQILRVKRAPTVQPPSAAPLESASKP
jgi:hypothetical protein